MVKNSIGDKMNIKNSVYKNQENTIVDVEIEHPQYGWISYTFKYDEADESFDKEIRTYLESSTVVNFIPPTQDELDIITETKILQIKKEALATLAVTTSNGNTFDGYDEARGNMLSALREGDASNETETEFWKLADNTFLTPCTYAELEEAHGLAIRAKGVILKG